MTKVTVLSRSFSRHPVLRAELLARYPDASFNDAGVSLSGEELIKALRGHQKAIVALEPISADVLDAVPELRVIAKYGVGFDKIDLAALITRDVSLGWAGGVNRRSVAELVIGFALSMLRKLPEANDAVCNDNWHQIVGRQLSDCTIGIIGCGHVGQDLGRILRTGFDCRVLAHDIQDHPTYYTETGVMPSSLDALLREADVISVHLPHDTSTANILDATYLSMIKASAILINTARGGLVDEMAIKQMLKAGTLAGAAFDVFACEPPEDQELLDLPNFFATPHVGGSTQESILAMGRTAIDGLDDYRVPEKGIFPPGLW